MNSDDMWRLADLLAHVSYKPEWVLLPEVNGDDHLAIYRTRPDSRGGSTGTILSRHTINFADTDAGILRQVYDALIECETHECQEFFRVDGEAVFDPHREDAP